MCSSAVWILFLLFCCAKPETDITGDGRCQVPPRKTVDDPCVIFSRTEESPVPCAVQIDGLEIVNQAQCLEQECCWFAEETPNRCVKRPVKCYADLRHEKCPVRKGFSESAVFAGYSVSGNHCFVDTIQPYFDSNMGVFGDSTSQFGIRISEKETPSCSIWTNTTVSIQQSGTCKVDYHGFLSTSGFIWADKCVIQQNLFFIPLEMNTSNTCICKLDSWLELPSENLQISNAIRDFVEREENRSSCHLVLGKLRLASWRRRLDIVNSAEANVVAQALLNITDLKKSMTKEEVDIILDTSEQLATYKFYEGLENDSAKLILQSATKTMDNMMMQVTFPNDRRKVANYRLMPEALYDDSLFTSATTATPVETEESLRWKIINNLEKISENLASMIKIPDNETGYVMSAAEGTVNLQVAVAKSTNASTLADITHSVQMNSDHQNARVVDFSSFDGASDDENLAVISVFYNTPKVNNAIHGPRNMLAINLRDMANGVVRREVSLPVRFTLLQNTEFCIENDVNGMECSTPTCAFAEENSERGEWSGYGCDVEKIDGNVTTCICNHTTHFAVLMMVTEESPLTRYDTRVLEILSIVLGSISVTALVSTCVVFIVHRKILLKDRMLIHFHLIVAMVCGYSFFLCGSIFSANHMKIPIPCFVAAIASHLFFLAAFFWSLVEGAYLFYKIVLVFSNKWVECLAKYSPIVGWICPALIVVASLIVSKSVPESGIDVEYYDHYYDMDTCFLQRRNGMIWAFVGPVLLIIAINLIVLVKVIAVIFRSSFSSSRTKSTETERISQSLRNSAKGATILMPILGIPWVVDLFLNLNVEPGIGYNYAATVAAYLHVVLMGIQGTAVFLFYCLFNTEVRNAYKLSAERRKSLASIESNTKRKRSRLPLLATKDESPDRYKTSLHVNTLQTMNGSLRGITPPPSPEMRGSLPAVHEESV